MEEIKKQRSKGKIIAGITADGGLDNKGELLIPLGTYFNWVKGEVEGYKVVVDEDFYSRYEDDFKRIIKDTQIIFEGDYEGLEELGNKGEDYVVIGSHTLYKEYINKVDYLNLLEVAGTVKSKHYFPKFDVEEYKVVGMEDVEGLRFWGVHKEYKRETGDEG